jgi:hypothetical protein
MLSLEQRRSDLQRELDSLVLQLDSLKKSLFDGDAPIARSATASAPRSRGGARKGGKRGALKEKIVAALESAGSLGVKVKDLAEALGTKPVNIHSWFHSALKRDKSITKHSGGHYRIASSSAAPKAPAKSTPQSTAGKKRVKGSKRGQLSASILEELKAAGKGGITVADLAKKLGANYKNIYIWFATTGKKHPVKKIAPATYSLA